MRHLLLPALTAILWVVNIAYVAATHAWPHLGDYDSGQLLLVGTAITVTIAWRIERHGTEYRIGYRQGREDRDL